ncbi:MAG: phage tail sheath subtilisin-like domain-containing protein [Thermoproteota archaeon]|nr:phage tail sheath subtilisin-like domain-containing protein [Thermoproteota archaeon]
MPITPTYPGVYIEELENPVRTIVGVSTSVTAFIGRAKKGPTNDPTLVRNFGDFERTFGGLWKKSTMSYSVYQYFLNGGVDALVIRVARSDATKALFSNTSELGLTFEAENPGEWANTLRIFVDHDVNDDASDKGDLFNVQVKQLLVKGETESEDKYVELESFSNLSFREDHLRRVRKVLEEESKLVRVNTMSLTARPNAAKFSPPESDSAPDRGKDGSDIDEFDLEGSKADPANKTGLYSLDKADIFNLLCIPPPKPDGTTARALYTRVYTAAAKYCKDKRAILIVDPPSNWVSSDSPRNATLGIDAAGQSGLGLTRSENAAIYFPRIKAPDPLEEYRTREFVPCGAIAGIIARTDAQRGVWKASAGIEATMAGVPDLTVKLTDQENGDLNPLGINCLRTFPVTGRVVWGARTMKGADRLANQWKYLPVRRTALYIEESLYRGTQWAVFEPNDEPLWSQLRLNVGAFMHDLFLKGAFQGSTPKEAYIVKCDKETTTQTDIDRGIVNIVVGFAPLKPAEFVIIKIQQLAGQTEVQ